MQVKKGGDCSHGNGGLVKEKPKSLWVSQQELGVVVGDAATTKEHLPVAAAPEINLAEEIANCFNAKKPQAWIFWTIVLACFAFFIAVLCSPCNCKRPGAVGLCSVEPSKWCDGVWDCVTGEDEAHCFRLRGNESVLESFSGRSQQWMPVCAEAWNHSYGTAVCQQLGFRRQDYVSFNQTRVASKFFLKLKPGGSPSSRPQSRLTPSRECVDNAVTLQCVECGRPAAAPSRHQAVKGAWPWQVSLQINSEHVCGGAIISPVWILSAAHCFQNCFKNPGLWRVYLGDVSLSQMSGAKRVLEIHTHYGYNHVTHNNDIALLRLTRPLTFGSTVTAVCLPNVGQTAGPESEAWTTGWGKVSQFDLTSPDVMSQAQVNVTSGDTCYQDFGMKLTKTMMCAGKMEDGVNACQGDSGGPLVVNQDSVWWLAGGASWGVGCAPGNKPVVYSNVTFFMDWIQKTMKML